MSCHSERGVSHLELLLMVSVCCCTYHMAQTRPAVAGTLAITSYLPDAKLSAVWMAPEKATSL